MIVPVVTGFVGEVEFYPLDNLMHIPRYSFATRILYLEA